MIQIAFQKVGAAHVYLPVNVQSRVVDAEAALGCFAIEVVAFILEDHFVCQYAETVGKSAWNEELTVVFSREFHFHVLAESRRSATYINSYIKYGALNDTNQLALCERWLLEMKSAHYSVRRFAFIVLYEMDFAYLFIKSALGKRFKKESAVISEDSALQENRAYERGIDNIHYVNPD